MPSSLTQKKTGDGNIDEVSKVRVKHRHRRTHCTPQPRDGTGVIHHPMSVWCEHTISVSDYHTLGWTVMILLSPIVGSMVGIRFSGEIVQMRLLQTYILLQS